MFEGRRGKPVAAADVLVNFQSAATFQWALKEEATMEDEEGDTYSEVRHFSQLVPAPRFRSHSDTSGFRSRVLFRLRGARSGTSDPHLQCKHLMTKVQ